MGDPHSTRGAHAFISRDEVIDWVSSSSSGNGLYAEFGGDAEQEVAYYCQGLAARVNQQRKLCEDVQRAQIKKDIALETYFRAKAEKVQLENKSLELNNKKLELEIRKLQQNKV